MKRTILMTFASLALATGAAWAGGDHGSHHADAKVAAADTAATNMAEGEVRKVDAENKKVTIKHGEIKNLQMPGMTMVFQVKDPAMLEKVKAGDKIRFNAERTGGAIVVTEIQPAK